MKTYPKSPLPSKLKSIPKGLVFLGKGREFKTLAGDFKGFSSLGSDKLQSRPLSLHGDATNIYYFAPADSEIARLNGLGPRKRKVTPKVRYFTNPSGFSGDVAYVRHDGNPAENVISVFKDGREALSPQVDLDFSLDACKRGVWKELSEKEALALVKPVVPPAPPKKATIGEVWDAFKMYRNTTLASRLPCLQIFSDESGCVKEDYSGEVFISFDDFSDALAQIKAATK